MNRPWLRGPLFDVTLFAFCWVPIYIWVVFVLGLGGEVWGMERLTMGQATSALQVAALVVLGLTYVHRHYTFVLIYGDAATFEERGLAYVVAPLVVFGIAAFLLSIDGRVELLGVSFEPFTIMLITGGLWNVWHTIQQRYGILRAYAGKAGGGLQERAHGRRDWRLLWSLTLAVAVTLPVLRPATFAGHGNARRFIHLSLPVTSHPAYQAFAALVVGLALFMAWRWWRAERVASVDRAPRWTFLGSTILLLVVFVVHGPIVGYLCFGAAHALEYLAFVHNHAEKNWRGRPERSFAALVLGRPIVFAPILIAGLGIAFLELREQQGTAVYLAYYVGSSILHFLYDGWIWKRRKPKPVGARAPGRR